MEEVKVKVFPFEPPLKKETPLEERLARIAATGDITRSVASSHLPHKKAKDAPQPTLVLQGRTVTDTKSMFIGSPAAFTDRPVSAPVRPKPNITENEAVKSGFEAKPAKDPFIKRVFEPVYNWPCAYAKDREIRGCLEEKLTTILFGQGHIAAGNKEKEKKKTQKRLKKAEKPLAIESSAATNVPMLSLPQYSSHRSSSLYDLRLREHLKAKVAHKLSRWKREVDQLLESKKSVVAAERKRLITENDKLVKDFNDIKEQFETQRKQVEETLKAIRGDREKEGEKEKELEKEFNAELPPARYPKSKAILKATADVEKWFTDTVLAKHKPAICSEKLTSSVSPPQSRVEIDQIYLTEVQPIVTSRPVLLEPVLPPSTVPRLEIAFQTPNDSFEEVKIDAEVTSEGSFEDIP